VEQDEQVVFIQNWQPDADGTIEGKEVLQSESMAVKTNTVTSALKNGPNIVIPLLVLLGLLCIVTLIGGNK